MSEPGGTGTSTGGGDQPVASVMTSLGYLSFNTADDLCPGFGPEKIAGNPGRSFENIRQAF